MGDCIMGFLRGVAALVVLFALMPSYARAADEPNPNPAKLLNMTYDQLRSEMPTDCKSLRPVRGRVGEQYCIIHGHFLGFLPSEKISGAVLHFLNHLLIQVDFAVQKGDAVGSLA